MMKKSLLLVLFVLPLLAALGCSAPGVTKTCLPGSVDCGNGCVQLQQDQLNCGVCGNSCGAGSVCSAGACSLSCQAGLDNCSGSCRDLQSDDANCGACGTACGVGRTCSAGACVANQCLGGVDPANANLHWTVCSATPDVAWVSSANPSGGNYHAEAICRSLGYRAVGQFGGNCGTTCGFCSSGSSCAAPGPQTFDGGGNCAADTLGQVLCLTVHWTCVP